MPTLVSGIDFLRETGFYSTVFPLILITAVCYGALTKMKVFGDNKGINITISALVGLIVISAVRAVDFITLFIQYMTVGATIILFVIMIFLFAGVEEKNIGEAMQTPLVYITIIAAVVVILFIVFSQAVPEIGQISEGGSLEGTSVTNKALETLFHPTVLGVVVMFAIFVVAVYSITRTPESA